MSEDRSEEVKSETSLTVIKAVDPVSSAGVLTSNALREEDDFSEMYFSAASGEGNVIQPPYDPGTLLRMGTENNTLSQCITAYEVNIDGTGFELENKDLEAEDAEEEKDSDGIKDFFNECWPRESFGTHRRRLRRDVEGSGNGYLEVIRNAASQLVFTRQVATQTMRICKLTAPVPVKKKITRAGKELEVTVMVRDRAFVQKVADKTVYFKEYGASRDINKDTGEWSAPGARLPAALRGTEILHFTALKDVDTPYGVPRWINQVPSVLGSRKAEELNLDFFDYGGIPPVLLMIQGGQMDEASKKQLERIMNKGPKAQLRAAILEVHSTTGTLDSNSAAKIDVEKFGDEQQKDSMYETYDDRCERRVRSSFRLPPLFLGKAEDYNYATAFASYTVTETQVFQPERVEFDEIVNNTIMKEFGDHDLVYRSSPLAVNDATMQLDGLEHVKESISGEDLVDAVNEITNQNLKFDQEAETERKGKEEEDRALEHEVKRSIIAPQAGPGTPKAAPAPGKGSPTPVKKSDHMELMKLASEWADLVASPVQDNGALTLTTHRVSLLSKEERDILDSMLSIKLYSHPDRDWDGAMDVCGCAADLLSRGKK